MLLLFTANDDTGLIRTFSIWVDDLESAFAFLNTLVSEGHQLLTIHLVEQGSRLELPPEAFDGHDFTKPFQALASQWQDCLKEPLLQPVNYNLLDLLNRQLQQYEQTISRTTQFITNVEQLITKAQTRKLDPFLQESLINYYQSIVRQSHQRIELANQGYERVVRRRKSILSSL